MIMDIEINVALFERMMKNIILLEYDSVLPKEKKTALKNIKIDLNNISSSNFKYLINVNCFKEIEIDGELKKTEYGDYLTQGLIEYYTFLICDKYSAEYKIDADYIDNYEFVKEISNVINLDEYAFSKNACEILNVPSLDKFKDKYDIIISKKYSNSLNDNEKNINSIEKENNENYNLYLVYIDGEQFIKYYSDKTHLIKTDNKYEDIVYDIYRVLKYNNKLDIA